MRWFQWAFIRTCGGGGLIGECLSRCSQWQPAAPEASRDGRRYSTGGTPSPLSARTEHTMGIPVVRSVCLRCGHVALWRRLAMVGSGKCHTTSFVGRPHMHKGHFPSGSGIHGDWVLCRPVLEGRGRAPCPPPPRLQEPLSIAAASCPKVPSNRFVTARICLRTPFSNGQSPLGGRSSGRSQGSAPSKHRPGAYCVTIALDQGLFCLW